MSKSGRVMIEVREPGGAWLPCWPTESHQPPVATTERERGKLGLKPQRAERIVAELTRPVSGYERLGRDPHPALCRRVRGYGVPADDVRVAPFKKGTWRKAGE